MPERLIFDSHLDLAWSAVFYNRDLTLPVQAVRARESTMSDERSRGKNVLSLPELRRAGVAVCVATLLARAGPGQKVPPTYKRTDLDYAAPSLAYAAAKGQLAYYELLESQGLVRIIRTRGELDAHWQQWAAGGNNKSAVGGSNQSAVGSGQRAVGTNKSAVGSGQRAVGTNKWAVGSGQWAVKAENEEFENKSYTNAKAEETTAAEALTAHCPLPTARSLPAHSFPLGIILSMEGTDPIVRPEQARHWHDLGLRAAGLAHYGIGQHAFGTGVSGPLSAAGIELLRVMDDLGMILDLTHLCDESMNQALEYFDGRVLASHHNCRALVPDDRQLSDEQIGKIIARGGVIGAALDAWMLYPGWVRGQTAPDVVTLADFANHIDRVCQLAGNARHAALGTDLDGGFGNEQTPIDLRIYGDLQNLAGILLSRGYSEADVDGIFHGNWLRFFSEALPT